MKKCIECGISFEDTTKNNNKKYCSVMCYNESKKRRQKNPLLKKICKICRIEFTPNSNNQLCCSVECIRKNKSLNTRIYQKRRVKDGYIRSTKNIRLKNKNKGLCLECGQKRLDNTSYCEEHYYKMISYSAMKTQKYWKELKSKYETQKGKCYYTGDNLIHGVNSSIDHIIPKSSKNKKVFTLENLVWCTREVNLAKRHTSLQNFIELCKKVSGVAYGDAGVSQVCEVGTVFGRSLRP